ncbi:MAG: hypothetical protein FJX52_05440 [Alphaproteobacteria bacterium]|nr:hypothetical protein [Alphaproteobacteria bacterium]
MTAWQSKFATLRRFAVVLSLAALAPLLIVLAPTKARAAGGAAIPDLAGQWNVQERNNPNAFIQLPLLNTNKDYTMVITQSGAELTLAMPSENMRFEPAPIGNGVIEAQGRHPSRGPVNLRLVFDDQSYRLAGLAKFQFELQDRHIEASLPVAESNKRLANLQGRGQEAAVTPPRPVPEVARLQEALRAGEERLAEEQRRAIAAEQRARELEQNVSDLNARRERDADRQLTQLRQERREQDLLIARLRNEITASHDRDQATVASAERRIATIGGELLAQKSEFEALRRALDEARARPPAPACEPPQQ